MLPRGLTHCRAVARVGDDLSGLRHPDRPHIRLYSDDDDGEIITYGDLWAEAGMRAAGLLELGLRRGDTVVLMLVTVTKWSGFKA